jgi:beta-glucanase (GH16 family)
LNIHGGAPADACTNPQFYGCERTGFPGNIINPIKSARVRTVHSFNFRYGKAEVRAKMPTGDWLWPAVWLMPKSNVYGTWPASGEIDLLESRGNLDYRVDGVHIGVEQFGSTLHFGPYPALNGYEYTMATQNTASGNGFNKDFHLYQLEWTPEYIRFSIDDKSFSQINGSFWELGQFDKRAPGTENPWRLGTKMAPFDQEFYFIINLAVGGSQGYFPDEGVNAGHPKPWKNYSPTSTHDFWQAKDKWLPTWDLKTNRSKEASLLVDYVKVWAL